MRQYGKHIVLFACGIIIGFLLGAGSPIGEKTKPSEEIEEGSREAWVIIETPGEKAADAWNITPKENTSLFKIMDTLAKEEKIQMKKKNFPGLGIMIEELQGKKNGENGTYWQYWINEKYAKVGADAYLPQGGDIIEWKFTNQQNF